MDDRDVALFSSCRISIIKLEWKESANSEPHSRIRIKGDEGVTVLILR